MPAGDPVGPQRRPGRGSPTLNNRDADNGRNRGHPPAPWDPRPDSRASPLCSGRTRAARFGPNIAEKSPFSNLPPQLSQILSPTRLLSRPGFVSCVRVFMTEPHRPRAKYVIGPDGSPLTI